MNYMRILYNSDIARDAGFMSHQWTVLGMHLPSMAVSWAGAIMIAILSFIIISPFAIAWNDTKGGGDARSKGLTFTALASIMIMLFSELLIGTCLTTTYTHRYSAYQSNMNAFTSSYGIHPDDVTVDQSDCTGIGYHRCIFSDMFKDNSEKDGWIHQKRKSWAINQNGDGRNLPMRITVTTPEGIRHMTIHVEGDSRLYLYEGTGDGQRLVKPYDKGHSPDRGSAASVSMAYGVQVKDAALKSAPYDKAR